MNRRRALMHATSGGEKINIYNYLTIKALADGLTASLSVNACEYCIDGNGKWVLLPAATTTPTINKGHTISFRGTLSPTSSNGIGTFTINKSCELLGNCMSMLFGDEALGQTSLSGKTYAFYKLFMNAAMITKVAEEFLPATTLSLYCYSYMFYGCTVLTQAPALPATTLAQSCYASMFRYCSKLTKAPILPATTLDYNCYNNLFRDCTKLSYIKALFTTTPGSSYTSYWTSNVASSGTFVKNAAATWNTAGVNGIPSGWTVERA